MSKSNHRHRLDKTHRAKPPKQLINPHCGHPLSDVSTSNGGTSYCRECGREARLEEIIEYDWDD